MLLIAVVLTLAAAKLTVCAERREAPLRQVGADVKVNIARIGVHDEYADIGPAERVGRGSPHGRRLEVKIRCCTICRSATYDAGCNRLKLSFRYRDQRNGIKH